MQRLAPDNIYSGVCGIYYRDLFRDLLSDLGPTGSVRRLFGAAAVWACAGKPRDGGYDMFPTPGTNTPCYGIYHFFPAVAL